jgi:hypothetical protein
MPDKGSWQLVPHLILCAGAVGKNQNDNTPDDKKII